MKLFVRLNGIHLMTITGMFLSLTFVQCKGLPIGTSSTGSHSSSISADQQAKHPETDTSESGSLANGPCTCSPRTSPGMGPFYFSPEECRAGVGGTSIYSGQEFEFSNPDRQDCSRVMSATYYRQYAEGRCTDAISYVNVACRDRSSVASSAASEGQIQNNPETDESRGDWRSW